MAFRDQQRPIAITVCVIVTLSLVNILWLPRSTVAIDPQRLIDLAMALSGLAAMALIGLLIERRMQGDRSRLGAFVNGYAAGLSAFSLGLGLFTAIIAAVSITSYLGAATSNPLVDGDLAAIDIAIGFNWPATLEVANASPLLARTLVIAYHSLTVQLAAVFLILAFSDQSRHLFEFLAAFAVAALITCVVMAVFPSAGAYAYFQPAPELHSSFTRDAGLWHYKHLLQLRSGEPFVMNQVEGLVTFPSFHTAVGILIPYALRDTRWLFGPAVALNALMIAGTIPEGGHYLIDVIAGMAIAVTAIFAVRSIQEGRGLIQSREVA